MRWLLLSLAAHLLLLGAVLSLRSQHAPESELEVEAPLGGVFVQEEAHTLGGPALIRRHHRLLPKAPGDLVEGRVQLPAPDGVPGRLRLAAKAAGRAQRRA